jgi:hypothetical protein
VPCMRRPLQGHRQGPPILELGTPPAELRPTIPPASDHRLGDNDVTLRFPPTGTISVTVSTAGCATLSAGPSDVWRGLCVSQTPDTASPVFTAAEKDLVCREPLLPVEVTGKQALEVKANSKFFVKYLRLGGVDPEGWKNDLAYSIMRRRLDKQMGHGSTACPLVNASSVWLEHGNGGACEIAVAMPRQACSLEWLQQNWYRTVHPSQHAKEYRPGFWMRDPMPSPKTTSSTTLRRGGSFQESHFPKNEGFQADVEDDPIDDDDTKRKYRLTEKQALDRHFSSKHAQFASGGEREPAKVTDTEVANMSQSASRASIVDLSELESLATVAWMQGQGATPMPEKVLQVMALDVLTALQIVHEQMFLMHNDVKPGNILLTKDRRGFQLCDFGFCGPVDEKGWIVEGGWAEGVEGGKGTPEYRGPEAFKKVKADAVRFSTKSDIWALGVTLLELAFGRMPPKCLLGEDGTIADCRMWAPSSFGAGSSELREHNFGFIELPDIRCVEKLSDYSREFRDFLGLIFKVNPDHRLSARQLLECPYLKNIPELTWLRDALSRYYRELEITAKKRTHQMESLGAPIVSGVGGNGGTPVLDPGNLLGRWKTPLLPYRTPGSPNSTTSPPFSARSEPSTPPPSGGLGQ